MKRLAIVGGGMSGLVCAWAFHQKGWDVKIFEPTNPGGEFLSGGLKYLQRTDEMVSMLIDLDIVFTNYIVQGGILLHGKVHPYPKCFQSMDKVRAKRIQYDHYRKTRRMEPGSFAVRSMNDPEAMGPRKALRCDFEELVRQLLLCLPSVHRDGVKRIAPNELETTHGEIHRFDRCVVTVPLWIAKRISHFHLPDTVAVRLNLISIQPLSDRFVQWDYVYTPYTPSDAIHRISPYDGKYSCEANGDWDEEAIQSDLNFLFPDGFYVENVRKGLNGHLLPLAETANWPDNIQPIGRFAKWDPRSTTDVALADSIALAEKWA